MRDDFSERTKEILAKRVGYRCSNPKCRKLTSGPRTEPDKVLNIGVAAHVTAASAAGPRYNPKLSSAGRQHVDNGIWLCENCAKLIDNDAARYTVDELRAWKRQAEEAALAEIERRDRSRAESVAPYLVPRVVAEFVGRAEELRQLARLLVPGQRVGITGLVGMGGLGKTELAKRAADRAAELFQDGVLWADCKEQGLGTIADLWAGAYGVQLPRDDEKSKLAEWRSLGCQKEALLIFDDVQPEQNIEPLIPPRGQCAVLVTTRYGTHGVLQGAARLDLDTFTVEEAAALLDEVMGMGTAAAQRVEAVQLFELTGFLPLALDVALRLAKQCGLELGTLNKNLMATGALRVLGDEKRLSKSLWATFETAWENLPAVLQEVFGLLSVFKGGPSFDTSAVAAVMNRDESVVREQLHRLVGWSLLKKVGDGRWGVHPLLGEFAGTRDGVDDKLWGRMAQHYLQVLQTVNELYEQGREGMLQGLALFDRERGHIEAGQAWAARRVGEDGTEAGEAEQLCSEYGLAVGHVMRVRLHPRIRLAWTKAAEAAARRLGDRAAEGKHLGNQGAAYINLADGTRAIECLERALAIAREVGDRRLEGLWLGNLCLAYKVEGYTQRAIEYCRQALEIHRALPDRWAEGNQLSNLGNAQERLGEWRQAIESYEQALAIRRDLADRVGEANDLGNLGIVYEEMGETQRAIEYFEQALAIRREIGDKRGEGAHLGNIGVLYMEQRDVQRAIVYYEQALALAREFGHPQLERNCLNNLGNAYKALGSLRRAVEFYEQALTRSQEMGNRRAEVGSWGSMGIGHVSLGDVKRGMEDCRRGLDIAQELEDAGAQAEAHYNFACAHAVMGDVERSLEHLREALTYSAARPYHEALSDPDFDGIRGDPRFKALMAEFAPRG